MVGIFMLIKSSCTTVRRRRSAPTWISRGVVLACVIVLAGLTPGCADRKEEYPSRPVILLCPWTAGGGTDRVARQLAVGLEGELGVPVNVVNATGAAGVTGHTRGALARPDGYTITLMTVELNMLHWRGLTPISYADYRPAALVNRDPAALFVRKDAPWQTLEELNAHVRAHPRQLRASGTAMGGIWHVATAGWLTEIGARPDAVRWISMEGASPSLQEMMAGGLDIVSCSLPEARSLLDAGEIRSLGVMSEERLAEFPNIATLKEQGVEFVLEGWRGIGMPAETPDEVSRVLAGALERVVKGDEFRRFMTRAGFNWAFEGPAEFSRSLAQMDQSFGALLTADAFKNMGEGTIGPMVFPAILLGLGFASLVMLVVTGGMARTESSDSFSWRGAWRVVEVLGGILLYLLVAEAVGFVITGFGITTFLMWRLGVRWWVGPVVSLILVVVVYQVFAIYLRVPLPQGIFGW
jgi:tripartite-type tricarboxylate transporter receptor subunit TctC